MTLEFDAVSNRLETVENDSWNQMLALRLIRFELQPWSLN